MELIEVAQGVHFRLADYTRFKVLRQDIWLFTYRALPATTMIDKSKKNKPW
jgi:hypothetical protein